MLSAPSTTWAKMVSASVPTGSWKQERGTRPRTSIAHAPAWRTHMPAERPVNEPGFQNSTALAEPRLAFLGDVFSLPASWPLSNVFSIGDVLIALGIVWALHRICRSRLAPSWARQHS